MLAVGYLARQPVRAAEGARAGPAMTTLTTVAARMAATIRGIALGYIAVQVVIWRSFYAADPWRLTGPVVAAACAVAVVGYLRWRVPGRRPPGWPLAVADSAVQVALALGAVSCVPAAMRGDTANWLYVGMASQLVIPAWFAPAPVFVPLALASGTAYWAGTVMSPAAAGAANSPAAAAAFLFAVAVIAWCGLRMIYRRAAAADVSLARADRDSRSQYVALSRDTERREHERLLHDTVLNTLTALARRVGSRADEVVARSRHDVRLMERVLTQTGDLGPPPVEPDGGLLAGLADMAAHMRARGLIVHLDVTRRRPAGDADTVTEGGGLSGDEQVLAVPPQVARAITHAASEALANVAAHAGTGEAWVEADLITAGAGQPGGLRVTVRDKGAGFDQARIDPARLGLRRSIVERAADWGAQASIRSAPGEGTVVSLGWTAPADTGLDGQGPDRVDAASTRRGGGAGDAYDFDLPRMAGTVAAIWQVTLLIQVLAYLHDYRQPAVVIAIWTGLLAAAVWLVPRARAGGLSGAEAVAAVAIAAAAVVLVGWERRAHGAAGTVDWSVAGTGWLLALVALSRPAWLWASGAILVFAAHAVVAIPLLGTASLGLARLAATAYSLVVVLAVFGAMRPAVRTQAAMAARRAALVSRAAAESAAADAVRADRRERLALLESEALPLLRGICDGTLDAADSDVRDRCARHAATLRRALVDRAPAAGGLLAELEPALRSAAARGVLTEVQVVGDPGRPGREVAGATLAAVDGVMRALPPHPVTLTVLAAEDDVELYVAFGQPPRAAPGVTELTMTELTAAVPAAAHWSATVDVEDSGAGCLEVRWRKLVAA